MNREILFRGKRIDNGEWVYGDLTQAFPEFYPPEIKMWVKDSYYATYPVRKETVGQHTGLCDKNGTKIFEGDVIRWTAWNKRVYERQVCYDEEWNRFCVWLSGTESLGVNKHLSDDIEVIGNIHDKDSKEGE